MITSRPSNEAIQGDPMKAMNLNLIMPSNGPQVKPCGPVVVMDSHVYLHATINDQSCLDLITAFKHVNKDLMIKALDLDLDPQTLSIKLHINSYGGSLLSGFSMMDAVVNSKIPVDTYIDGYAASAGTIISIAGRRRYMTKNSQMLIHQLSAGAWGNYEQLKDQVRNLDQSMEMIRSVYNRYTEVPPDMLNEILTHDIWWDSKQCLEYGLVDEVV